MFDFNLTDISATLCVGVMSILLIGYLYYIGRKFFYPDFDGEGFIEKIKQALNKEHKSTGYFILGVIWIYCVGFFIGDLTGRMTDSDTEQTSLFLKVLQSSNQMKKQEETRLEAFFYAEKKTDTSMCICSGETVDSTKLKPTALGRSALNTKMVVDNANLLAGTKIYIDTLCPLEENWEGITYAFRSDSNYRKGFKNFVHQIYYTGKNWCYAKEGEPLNELKAIQNRIDMARSTVLLVDFGFFYLFLIVLYKLIHIRRCKALKKCHNYDFEQLGRHHKFFHLSQIHVFSILLLIWLFARQCFEIDQSNYVKRACGYYIGDINRAEHLQPGQRNREASADAKAAKN